MSQETIASLRQKFDGKKVLVVGLGLQGGGLGMARFFSQLGAKVTVTDKKTEKQLAASLETLKDYPITFHLGNHNLDDFINTDFIFKGPSVLWTTPEIQSAIKKGIPVEMELSFVAQNCEAKIIGITGTRGKSTTTNLIFNLLKLSGFSVFLGGGLPGISTIDYLKTLGKDDYLVMELSSWALSGFHQKKISPHISVFTNIYPDHLNYYSNIEDYLYDKKAIGIYQKRDDYLVINQNLTKYFEKQESKVITFTKADYPEKLVYLKGDHNLENAAAALKVAEILKIDKIKATKIISNYRGLPFRQETIGTKGNVTFVNDTTSTTPIATVKAIESFSDKPIYLILGGNSKNLPWDILINSLTKVKKIVLLSGSFTKEAMPVLKEKFADKLTEEFTDLDPAIKKAFSLASEDKKPAYLLFSPGATSFAMFNNEFHRGREFNRIVKEIIEK